MGASTTRARSQLRRFRQASVVAVATTGFLLLLLAPEQADGTQDTVAPDTVTAVEQLPDTVAVIRSIPTEALQQEAPVAAPAGEEEELRADTLARRSQAEATRTIRNLWAGFLGNLPKVLVALGVMTVAWIVVRLLRPLLIRVTRGWERGNAIAALFGVVVWLLAIGVVLSVLVGDIRALVGSLGLVGLALSWALQTPIESFTGWLLNSFQGYYRVGDRVAVGEVFGDVFRIDFLTTTVWEIGAPDRPGFVQAEQPTGRLITFPNNEVLTGSIVNLTRDFPFVWDELTLTVANESDLRYAVTTVERLAREILGDYMAKPAEEYEEILKRAALERDVPEQPQVFVSADPSWMNLTIRYLVGARERRRWKTELNLRMAEELAKPEHRGRIIAVYPRQQIQLIGPGGVPLPPDARADP